MKENDYIPIVLQFDNIYSIYLSIKPAYENEIHKVKNEQSYLSDTINTIDSIQDIINTSIMKSLFHKQSPIL